MSVTKFAQNGLVRLAYEVAGQGPAVVLLHGLLGDRVTMRPLADALAARFTVLSVDLRGHGGSSAVHGVDVSLADLAADVAAVMDAANVDNAAVVAMDIAADIASELGERATAIIAINPLVDLNVASAQLEQIADDAYKGLGEKSVNAWLDRAWGSTWSNRVPRARVSAARRNAAALHPYLMAVVVSPGSGDHPSAITLPGGAPFADAEGVAAVANALDSAG